jgi:hypothetical protein
VAKKAWILLPLITATDLKDESVVAFLKGGVTKDLEIEAAAFITRWLMHKSIPFARDFEASPIDRDTVLEALPRRLQKVLGFKAVAVRRLVAARRSPLRTPM